MKTLFVTYGEWVRTRTALDLPEADFDRLSRALEDDDAAIRHGAQLEVLSLARSVRGGWQLDSSEPTLEALEYEADAPSTRYTRRRDDAAEWAPAA